ncbi:MAG: hypothetical protein R2911_46455 [Caldilineaceae bacterium]
MKLARFAYNGAVHNATLENGQLMVGSVAYDPDDVMWLPPVDPQEHRHRRGAGLCHPCR